MVKYFAHFRNKKVCKKTHNVLSIKTLLIPAAKKHVMYIYHL